ncbi:MAG: single-stranded DNA-binding protein [Bacteroidales bacterium]|jgi:single-strand DNA-binding protein|nr:single-stranded DNA-binding protein [Bacteroidales bacterium]
MLNKVLLIGRLGKNPDINYVQPDVPVARLSLATTEYYKTKEGERKDITEWHNITTWRNQAKFVEQYLEKGMLIYVEGKLQTRHWTDQNGIERHATDIVADTIRILERKSDRLSNNANIQTPTENIPNNAVQEQINSQLAINSENNFDINSIINETANITQESDSDLPF